MIKHNFDQLNFGQLTPCQVTNEFAIDNPPSALKKLDCTIKILIMKCYNTVELDEKYISHILWYATNMTLLTAVLFLAQWCKTKLFDLICLKSA